MAQATVFANARLIDGLSASARTGVSILVEGERIRQVSEKPIAATGAKVVDLAGKTVLPGLIDTHIHTVMMDAECFPLFLAAGVTTARDVGGRLDLVLQNRADLMEELAKIVRVIRRKDPDAPHNTLLVLDATTGQNALSQVETFQKLADVSGLVMTKLDGTAKGGVLVALADKFGLPIHAIGVGEQIDDLAPFDPDDFARALTGADT